MHAEDDAALVKRHVPLARAMAIERRRPGVETDDLIGAAYLGLCLARRRYDPARPGGATFGAFARHAIAGAIADEVARHARYLRRHDRIDALPGGDAAPVLGRDDPGPAAFEDRDAVAVALAHLPPVACEAARLHADGLDWSEVAARLRISRRALGRIMQAAHIGERPASRHRGVSRHRGRWRAQVFEAGRVVHLGVFDSEDEAAAVAAARRAARDEARQAQRAAANP